jgi:exopolyphosphatase/guanosine-5'-triphosphate,3'-diphosphate pyrophosphatase
MTLQTEEDTLSRCAVVDLGSNSVRLVVFEGHGRNPTTIFNEKAVLRLGRGLQASGQLNPEGVAQAVGVMTRFGAIARAMRADPFEVLATAAVRDASNGPAFVETLRAALGPDVPIRILPGQQEAALSAAGLLCGIPQADGILADIGGGSLELVRLQAGEVRQAVTLPLGVIRLADRAGGDALQARNLVDSDFDTIPWLVPPQDSEGERDLYLVGGAWRALARIHMAETAYPLNIVHHYVITRDAARDLAQLIATAGRRALERMGGVSRRRIDDMPMAAVVLRRLLRSSAPRRVVFSANGLREGWFISQVDAAIRQRDPLIEAGRDYAQRFGRDASLPPLLVAWTDTIFAGDSPENRRLREAACWMSDIASHDHPEFRAQQAFYRVLRQPGIGLDHHARAFLALAMAIRYDAEPQAPYLTTAKALLDVASFQRAERLGVVLRLAYTVSAGTADLLRGTSLFLQPGRVCLRYEAPVADAVLRRLERLGTLLGLEPALEEVT